MKITIDKSIPDMTQEEIAALEESAIPTADNPEKFKDDMLKAKEVVFSPQVVEQLKEMGLTPDELVAMMLKTAKAQQ